MKQILLLLILMISFFEMEAQYGISMYGSSSKAFGFDFILSKESNRFHVGLNYQFNGQAGTVVKERKPNYGTTRIDNGEYFWLVDIGFSKVIRDKLSIHAEISLGQTNFFTNFEDNRFRGNAYSLIITNESKAGAGLNIGFLPSENFEFFAGYSTAKKTQFGLRFLF